MGREPRLQIASGIYHVTASGNRRQSIFFDERAVLRFAEVCGLRPGSLVSTQELLRNFGPEERRAAERYRAFIRGR